MEKVSLSVKHTGSMSRSAMFGVDEQEYRNLRSHLCDNLLEVLLLPLCLELPLLKLTEHSKTTQ